MPFYIKTKMIRNMSAFDVVEPNQIVEGAFCLLGRKTEAMGCIKHEFIAMALPFLKNTFNQRV